MENKNKKDGTILDKLVVIKTWNDNKNDYIQYTYSHESGEHGPYTAYIPLGQVDRLGLKKGLMYRITTKKIAGRFHWIKATKLKRITSIIEGKTTTLNEFFEGN